MMIGNIILAVLGIGLCSVIFNFKEPIIGIVETLCGIIDLILRPLSKPLRKLWELIKKGLLRLFSWSDCLPVSRFSDNFPVFGTPSAIRLFLVCLVYLTITLVFFVSGSSITDFVLQLIYYMPLGFLIQWITEGLAFDLVSLLSAGFTGFLIMMLFRTCMKDDYYGSEWARLPVKILYYLVLSVTACTLSYQFAFVWDFLASFGLNTFHAVGAIFSAAQWDFVGILKMLLSGIVFLLLLYFGILLLLISLREYIDIIGYSIIGVLLLLVFTILLNLLPDALLSGTIGDILSGLMFIGVMLYSDYSRVNADLEGFDN